MRQETNALPTTVLCTLCLIAVSTPCVVFLAGGNVFGGIGSCFVAYHGLRYAFGDRSPIFRSASATEDSSVLQRSAGGVPPARLPVAGGRGG